MDHKEATEGVVITNVWAHNLQQELSKIIDLIERYPFISMDTEFPGIVARPVSAVKNDYQYQTLKCNVDLLKIIQLGIALYDEHGNRAPGESTWQFNFKFNLNEDMYAQDSIELLKQAGIDFKEHDSKGIDVVQFGDVITTSGLVLNDEVKWISFHSSYDFGYLLKVLTCQALPKEETDFFELFHLYFPCMYDIKYLMKSCENLNGGLNKLAEDLDIQRIGPEHQAGSDSLLTGEVFFKLRERFFEDKIDDDKFMGVLYGLGTNIRPPKNRSE